MRLQSAYDHVIETHTDYVLLLDEASSLSEVACATIYLLSWRISKQSHTYKHRELDALLQENVSKWASIPFNKLHNLTLRFNILPGQWNSK